MTDPERISQRSMGLAAQLLRAGADEQPGDAGLQQTLAALGISAAVASSAGTVSAALGGAKATGALSAGGAGLGASAAASAASGTVKAVSTTLLLKWIALGMVGGVGLAGAAAVATSPASSTSSTSPAPVAHAAASAARARSASLHSAPALPLPSSEVEALPVDASPPPIAVLPRSGASAPLAAPVLEVGAPLAAEVAYVDRARGLLRAGQTEQGLRLLQDYERQFPEPRLLPEVLFLQLETCDRLGRKSEARSAAQRLLDGFPQSPHASRARKLLFP